VGEKKKEGKKGRIKKEIEWERQRDRQT
jgi:hypothetical protein